MRLCSKALLSLCMLLLFLKRFFIQENWKRNCREKKKKMSEKSPQCIQRIVKEMEVQITETVILFVSEKIIVR